MGKPVRQKSAFLSFLLADTNAYTITKETSKQIGQLDYGMSANFKDWTNYEI